MFVFLAVPSEIHRFAQTVKYPLYVNVLTNLFNNVISFSICWDNLFSFHKKLINSIFMEKDMSSINYNIIWYLFADCML